MAIVRPQFAPGFMLAGVDVFETEDVRTAERKVKDLLKDPRDYHLVIVDDHLSDRISAPTRARMFTSTEPVFIDVGLTGTTDENIIREIQNLAQEALGYAIRIDV